MDGQDLVVSAEIISSITEKIFSDLKSPPKRIGVEDVPIPSTRALAVDSYPTPSKIIKAVSDLVEVEIKLTEDEKKQDPFRYTRPKFYRTFLA